jgi:hypothetical protein
MKRQIINLSMVSTLAFILAVFAINGCEDSVTGPPPSLPPQPGDLLGTWFQQPLIGDKLMERSLDFSDGYGTIIYPDRTGECQGKPELLKSFTWEEMVEGSQTLRLNVFRHEECGIAKEQPYEEIASFNNSSNILRMFSNTWMR